MTAAPRGHALVTGASRGIGCSTAEALAAAGFDVAFTARTVNEGEGTVPPRSLHGSQEAIAVPGSLATTESLIRRHGVRALPVSMDLTDPDSVTAAAETVLDTWGAPTVLVNNALLHLPQARFLELTADNLRASLEANLVEQVRLTQMLLPAMIAAGGGVIVDLCSGSATHDPRAAPGEGGWSLSYSAAKAAFGRIAGAINAEHRGDGIRAFNIEPGFVVTEAGAARGGTDSITGTGFAGSPVDASGRVIVWLATAPGAETERFLGKVVNAPRLAEDLAG